MSWGFPPAKERPKVSPAYLRLLRLGLPYLSGSTPVHHSNGAGSRARDLQSLVDRGRSHLTTSLGVRPDVRLAVLNPADWEREGSGLPYGLPWYDGEQPSVVYMGSERGVAEDIAMGFEGFLSAETKERIIGTGFGGYEASVDRFVDSLALHEVGHAFLLSKKLPTEPLWLNELLASYLAYATLQALEPKLAELYDAMHDAYAEGPPPSFVSLKDFEQHYTDMEPSNYGWFQGMFQKVNESVFKEKGMGFVNELLAAFPPSANGSPERVSTDEALLRLQRLHPAFAALAGDMTGA
jgi:hypothetical protein